jgi:hypothetical protein
MWSSPSRHPNNTSVVAAAIASGAALSAEIDLNGQLPVAIVMPAEWTAANLTLQISIDDDGAIFNNVYDGSTEYTVTAAASRYICLELALVGVRKLKIRSGTSGTPVNQAAARALSIVTVPV